MSYLLDTCVVSELVKPAPDAQVVAWLRHQPEEQLYLSVLTLGELQKGIARLRDGRRRRSLQAWLDGDLEQRFAGRVLALTRDVARAWGRVQAQAEQQGRRLPLFDSLIAATALTHDAAVVTRNEDDVRPSGVRVVNPWRAA